MTHEEARDRLLDLAYGELGTGDRGEVEAHVAGCADCAAELATLVRTRAAVHGLPDPSVPGRRAELLAAARLAVAKPPAPRRPRWSRPAAWVAMAATVAVVGGVTLRWLGETPRRDASEDRVVAAAPPAEAKRSPPVPPPAAAPAAAEKALPAVADSAAPAGPAPPAPPAAASRRPAEALASRELADAKGEGLAAAGARPAPARAKEAAAVPPATSIAFVSQDLATGAFFRVNPAGCATRHSPFSTFEIPATLVAHETGEGASQLGEPRMKQWLATFGYGNQDVSGGHDRFWLGSSLRISADEQVAFLANLLRGKLPVAKRSLDRLQEVMQVTNGESSGARWRLVAKAGSLGTGEGWLVGWVEREGGSCVFALHVEAPSEDEMSRIRPGLAREFLGQARCLPQ